MTQKSDCLTAVQKEVVSNLKNGFFLARKLTESGWHYSRGSVIHPVLFGYVSSMTFNKLLEKKMIKRISVCCKIVYYGISDIGKEYN